jgi:hypothetical protein
VAVVIPSNDPGAGDLAAVLAASTTKTMDLVGAITAMKKVGLFQLLENYNLKVVFKSLLKHIN